MGDSDTPVSDTPAAVMCLHAMHVQCMPVGNIRCGYMDPVACMPVGIHVRSE